MSDSSKVILVTDNLGGNVHEAASTINKWGLAEFVVSLQFNGGNYSTVVYKMTVAQRKQFSSYLPAGRPAP